MTFYKPHRSIMHHGRAIHIVAKACKFFAKACKFVAKACKFVAKACKIVAIACKIVAKACKFVAKACKCVVVLDELCASVGPDLCGEGQCAQARGKDPQDDLQHWNIQVDGQSGSGRYRSHLL